MKQNLNNRKPESQMEKAEPYAQPGLRNSAAPLNFTLRFSQTFQTSCNMHYRMYNSNHELHVARIQAQDQPKKTRF